MRIRLCTETACLFQINIGMAIIFGAATSVFFLLSPKFLIMAVGLCPGQPFQLNEAGFGGSPFSGSMLSCKPCRFFRRSSYTSCCSAFTVGHVACCSGGRSQEALLRRRSHSQT